LKASGWNAEFLAQPGEGEDSFYLWGKRAFVALRMFLIIPHQRDGFVTDSAESTRGATGPNTGERAWEKTRKTKTETCKARMETSKTKEEGANLPLETLVMR
jgi:hypothetical protein